MEWLKLELRNLRGQQYLGSEPVARATWLSLLGYCADTENGGVIENCASWPDRKWQQVVGVTTEEAHLETELYTWEGENLRVEFYPSEGESVVKARRAAGKRGAASRWDSKPDGKPPNLPNSKSSNLPDAEQSRAEKNRTEKSRAEGKPSGCKGLDWDSVVNWMDLQNGSIPDRHRAEALARELIQEMEAKKWRLDGEPVDNPMGLLITRLKRDGAYKPKSK